MTGYVKYIFPDGAVNAVWTVDGHHWAMSVVKVPEGLAVNAGPVDGDTVRKWDDTAESVIDKSDNDVMQEVVPA